MTEQNFLPSEATRAALARLPDDGPVVMLNLLEFPDDGATYAKYARIALPQIRNRGGAILYAGTPLIGDAAAGHWDRVILVGYPNRAAFLDMLANSDYQRGLPHRAAGLVRTVLYAFVPRDHRTASTVLAPVPVEGGDEIFVLNLLRFRSGGGRESYLKYSEAVTPLIQERGGRPALILEAQLPLVSDETWQDLYLVRYPNIESLSDMVGTETWRKANEHRHRGLDLTWAFPTRPLG